MREGGREYAGRRRRRGDVSFYFFPSFFIPFLSLSYFYRSISPSIFLWLPVCVLFSLYVLLYISCESNMYVCMYIWKRLFSLVGKNNVTRCYFCRFVFYFSWGNFHQPSLFFCKFCSKTLEFKILRKNQQQTLFPHNFTPRG